MTEDDATADNGQPHAVGAPVERPVRPAAGTRRYGRFTAPSQWAHEFRTELKRVMAQPALVDLRNFYRMEEVAKHGFRYVSIGRPNQDIR